LVAGAEVAGAAALGVAADLVVVALEAEAVAEGLVGLAAVAADLGAAALAEVGSAAARILQLILSSKERQGKLKAKS
jgi:hypothetical protein